MTNLEFYKEEIKKEITARSYSHATSTYESLVSCYKKYCNKSLIADSYEILDWLCEEHQILDKEEKKYLSNVIRPFANRMVSITKIKDWIDEDSNFEVLEIALRLPCKNQDMEFVHLPYFEKGTMYKGMELNKEYTLEDLGL